MARTDELRGHARATPSYPRGIAVVLALLVAGLSFVTAPAAAAPAPGTITTIAGGTGGGRRSTWPSTRGS